MTDKFYLKVKKYIEENSMIEAGDTIVAGVSGGADSVALFLVLTELTKELSFSLKVVHVNHGLRKEAAKEAEYVEALCRERNIPFILKEYDVKAYAKAASKGTEEAGRMLRYQSFSEALCGCSTGKIAVAHHMNDQAETMLFHLFRGTGAKGLSSIAPVRDNVIRPLLCVTRQEIEDFVTSRKVSFCVDASNKSDEYTRNRIRNLIIPSIEENVSKDAVLHMAQTAKQLRELNAFAESEARKTYERLVISRNSNRIVLDKKEFLSSYIYVRKLLIKYVIDELVPHNRDITQAHIESVAEVAQKDGSHSINLPYKIVFTVLYDTIEATTKTESPKSFEGCKLATDGKTTIPGFGSIACEVKEKSADFEPSRKKYTKCFDYDKIEQCLEVRTRNSKDFIIINSAGGTKRLQDYFVNEKIPAKERDTVPVIADGNHIIWVVGYRISEAVKVTESTKRVLYITVTKEDE